MFLNNKIKQYLGGNWGKPTDVEHDIDIPGALCEDKETVRTKKKKKKIKRDYRCSWECCPFCDMELLVDEEKLKEEKKGFLRSVFEPRKTECHVCGSYEVTFCPACKRTTWYNPNTKIYKHQKFMGCGFEGKKLDESHTPTITTSEN